MIDLYQGTLYLLRCQKFDAYLSFNLVPLIQTTPGNFKLHLAKNNCDWALYGFKSQNNRLNCLYKTTEALHRIHMMLTESLTSHIAV